MSDLLKTNSILASSASIIKKISECVREAENVPSRLDTIKECIGGKTFVDLISYLGDMEEKAAVGKIMKELSDMLCNCSSKGKLLNENMLNKILFNANEALGDATSPKTQWDRPLEISNNNGVIVFEGGYKTTSDVEILKLTLENKELQRSLDREIEKVSKLKGKNKALKEAKKLENGAVRAAAESLLTESQLLERSRVEIENLKLMADVILLQEEKESQAKQICDNEKEIEKMDELLLQCNKKIVYFNNEKELLESQMTALEKENDRLNVLQVNNRREIISLTKDNKGQENTLKAGRSKERQLHQHNAKLQEELKRKLKLETENKRIQSEMNQQITNYKNEVQHLRRELEEKLIGQGHSMESRNPS